MARATTPSRSSTRRVSFTSGSCTPAARSRRSRGCSQKKALSLRPPLSIIILIIILRLKELRGRRTRRVTGHGSANCHMRLTAGGETVQRALDRKRLDVEGARALGRLYTYGGGLGSVPPRCARTMPNKTVVHAFVEAFGRCAPRSRGAALAAFPARRRMQQLGGRASSLCPHASGWTRAQRALVVGDLALVEPEAVKEAVDVHVVLRLHARRGDRRRIRIRLLLP